MLEIVSQQLCVSHSAANTNEKANSASRTHMAPSPHIQRELSLPVTQDTSWM